MARLAVWPKQTLLILMVRINGCGYLQLMRLFLNVILNHSKSSKQTVINTLFFDP
jgi:hypothetical protein